MTSDQSSTQLAANSTINGSPEEQTRLEDALRRADELLVTSLKSEERRRWRRNIVIFSLGGLIMLTALGVLLLCWAGDNKPTAADQQKAAQVSQEGWQLWKGQQYGPAIDKFQEAVKLDPKNVTAWNGLGWSQFNSGQIVEAKTSFNKLLELDPKFVAGLNGLGWAQFNSGEYQNAEATFRSLLKIEPTIPGGLNGLGQLYLAQRKYDEAEKYLLKAAPQAPAAWYGLARLYLLQGKFDDAAKWAKKVVASGQADDSVKQMLKAAEDKKLPDDLRKQIEPPPAADKSSEAVPEPKHEAKTAADAESKSGQQSDTDEWAKRLVELKNQDWRVAFALGQELADFPPDEGYAILKQNWAKIGSVDAKQQILKAWFNAMPYPLHARNHPRLLDVLDFGMRDPSPQVQQWAILFLKGVAFQDLGEDFPGYKTWYAANRSLGVTEAISNSVKQLVAETIKAEQNDAEKRAKFLNEPEVGFAFRDVPEARRAAIDAGLPKLLEKWIAAGAKPTANKSQIQLATQGLQTLGRLQLNEDEMQRVITPLLNREIPGEVRTAAIQSLDGKQNRWAMDLLLEVLKDCVTQQEQNTLNSQVLIWATAGTLASMDDPKVIPTMIAVIEADNTYDTVYGIGYFGLGRLTGVQYDDAHNGKWWRDWWEKNKERFPADVRQVDIPHIDKKLEVKSNL